MQRRQLAIRLHLSLPLLALAACGPGGGEPTAIEEPAVDTASTPIPPVTPPAHPRAREAVGITVHRATPEEFIRVAKLGVDNVRFTLYRNGWWDSNYRDLFALQVRAARMAGMEVCVVVHDGPQPARLSPEQRALRAGDFATFVAARAGQFREVRAWQLDNEWDVGWTDAYGALSGLPPEERGRLYGRMLALAYPAIKAANPNALVITGGLQSVEDDLGAVLAGMAGAGAIQADALGIHTYGLPVAPVVERKAQIARRWGLPLWLTEVGMEREQIPADWGSTPDQVDERQAYEWASVFGNPWAYQWYERIYGYRLMVENPLDHGIVRADGSLRPAALWLASYLRGD